MLVKAYVISLFSFLELFITNGVMSSCIDGSGTINATQVTRMCHNSTVTGTSVYIDADAAGSTTQSSGVACTCTATSQVGKRMVIQSNFIGTSNSESLCGTTMEYSGQGIPGGNLSHSCNSTMFNVTTNTYWFITVGVRKDQSPYLTQYCVSLELKSCSPGQFQCNNGDCIPEASKCNANPDCTDGSDEDTCAGPGQCFEGLVLCDGGQGCRPQNGRCNNVTDCTDGSDEKNCDSGSGISTTKAPNAINTTTPLITVTCTESEFLPQTTTTTAPATTTTSTTATTTTPTTTITAPTTTVTSTTTTPTTTTPTTTTAPTTTTTSKTTITPQTTTSKTTTVSPTTTFSPTTSSETQPNTHTTTTNAPTTTPIKTTANSVPSASPPTPTTSARSSTTMDISTSAVRTDYSKPAPDPFPPWLIGGIAGGWTIAAIELVVIIALATVHIRYRWAAKNTEAMTEANLKNPNYDTLVRGPYDIDLLDETTHIYSSVSDVNMTTTAM